MFLLSAVNSSRALLKKLLPGIKLNVIGAAKSSLLLSLINVY